MDDFSRIKEFHGHAGIWVGIGFRAGKHAKNVLKPERYKDLFSKVSMRYEIPYSCLLDGIQVSSGCTLGKKNIEINNASGNPRIEFLNRKTRERIVLKIRKGVLEEIFDNHSDRNLPDEDGLRWILGLDFEEIFERES